LNYRQQMCSKFDSILIAYPAIGEIANALKCCERKSSLAAKSRTSKNRVAQNFQKPFHILHNQESAQPLRYASRYFNLLPRALTSRWTTMERATPAYRADLDSSRSRWLQLPRDGQHEGDLHRDWPVGSQIDWGKQKWRG